MGNYLSEPNKTKEPVFGKGNGIKFGGSSMQGWRKSMEDAHICEPNFTQNSSLFAIFDGHAGREMALFCAKYLGPQLKKNKKFSTESSITQALVETFLQMDIMARQPEYIKELKSLKNPNDESMPGATNAGCTANIILIHKGTIYCANAGDSRTILWSDKKVVPLSIDHKPENPEEFARIQNVFYYKLYIILIKIRQVGKYLWVE